MYFFSPFTKLKTALHRLDHFDMASVYYNYVSPFILYHVKIQSVPIKINTVVMSTVSKIMLLL